MFHVTNEKAVTCRNTLYLDVYIDTKLKEFNHSADVFPIY